MILIAGTLKIVSDDPEAVLAAVLAAMAETKQEEGCVSYDFSVDLLDPTVFHVSEEWESSEHLAAHAVAPHMLEFRTRLGDVATVERNLYRYEVSDKSTLG